MGGGEGEVVEEEDVEEVRKRRGSGCSDWG
jgi:hypothetical protein